MPVAAAPHTRSPSTSTKGGDTQGSNLADTPISHSSARNLTGVLHCIVVQLTDTVQKVGRVLCMAAQSGVGSATWFAAPASAALAIIAQHTAANNN